MHFTLIIPVYNEEETLEFSLTRLNSACIGILSSGFQEIELIFVNDGSNDESFKILDAFRSRIATNSPIPYQVRILEFSKNFGHAAAVLAGLEHATGDIVGIIDADLQDPPELLLQMIHHLKRHNVDVVYGQRKERKGETLFKKLTAWLFYRLINLLTGVRIPKDTGDFRVMRREVVDAVLLCTETDPFIRGIVAWVGFKQLAFPYIRDERRFGTTKYPLRKMLKFAATAIISFSGKPLVFSLYFGLFGLTFSILLGVWTIASWRYGGTVPGWASLTLAISLSQSFVLVLLGVQGLYISRVHASSLARPRYILKNIEENADHSKN